MDSLSDNTLMLKVKEGDLDKLGLLFERYHRRLYGFFFRMTGRRDVSEDLVQGVFERILKYRHSYTNGRAFSTWIFQIARNLQADYYKARQKEGEHDEPVDWEQLEGAVVPASSDEKDEKLKLLNTALNRLDPAKKEPLILSRYQGFKYREIAGILDCSENAVKVRVFRAINELKEIISELRKEEDYD